MRAVWRFAIGIAALGPLLGGAVDAQQADVIRGQVLAEDGEPVVRAGIQVRSIPSNIARSTTTDATGRYAITYANGEGDYWISVTAIGFTPRRFELKRLADEQVLIGNVKLVRSGVVLDAVEVQGARVRPGRSGELDVTGTEKTLVATGGDPTQAGSLAALAAGAPGVQLIPGAEGNPDQFSVFGLSGDQNNATLNGLSFGGADVPRDAATRAMLGTSPWDVARGGFSGGQISLSTQSGSNFSARSLSSLLNGPGLQWTDRAGRALGAEYASASVGAAMSGPIELDKAFYGIGFQFDRRMSDMSNLAVANPFALKLAGVAADSVARLATIMTQLGIPRVAPGLPALRSSDRGLLLASIDLAPATSTSGQALNVTAAGSFTRLSSPFAQVTGFPTNDAKSLSWFGSGQLRHTNYFAAGVLSESSLGVTASNMSTDPYLAMPNGAVRVASALDDGSTGVTGLSFGGSQTQQTSTANVAATGQNQLSWFSRNSRHRIKLTSSLRYETSAQDFSANRLGTFRYNSLSDLEQNLPGSFTRVLSDRVRTSDQVIA
ncbi:MAG: carboxypeptidase-like regulatory domain-containing protein, partial [Gemmatimonadaceae bacterium]